MPVKFTRSLLLISVVFSSCYNIGYIGQSYAATDKIDVYITEQSIRKPFQYIGKGYLSLGSGLITPEKIQQMAESLGKKKGADAVLITDYLTPNTNGTNITTVSKSDSSFSGTVHTSSTTVSPSVESNYNILYIKYSN